MQPFPRADFARRLRRIAAGAFVDLVADLLRARGWDVAVDGRALVASRDGTERLVYVLPSARSVVGLLRTADAGGPDAVVARGGSALRAAVLARAVRNLDYAVYGPDRLHELVWYAIDGDRRADLLARYLDLDPATIESARNAATDGRETAGAPAGSGASRVATAGIVVALVLVAGAIGSAFVASDPPEGVAPATVTWVTPARVTPTATPTSVDPSRTVCALPPDDVPAGALRPRIDATETRWRWRVTLAQNVTRFDALDERSGRVPEDRYAAIYVDRGGNRFWLEIDRWRTEDLARAAAAVEANRSDLWLVWGQYTTSIRAYDANWTPLPTTTVVLPGSHLLADVRVPGGGQLGLRCVTTLVGIGTRPGGGETADRTNATPGRSPAMGSRGGRARFGSPAPAADRWAR